ncbi:MAG: inorganic phosphate transporter [Bacteroidetes bacterium]|jgi:PiT family inorganic phosphate transporter|nr:inorganic phosphate transporter [Bacteroidota bacterium]MBP6401849.1 inorganic phosphate transporter [Bacteroidia bacterium]MBK6840532.1 inorganic phosphate transporter [Bacteroidota bacterium]MBK9541665.1 inorganic phosphate transporter [Bacteroidota bacterium]MBL0258452.1 inorganic phosphate transporter [Bacteroidota bacterium]
MQLITLVIILALIFDFINGFHDAANSIATVVSTKVLSPLTAVIWAAAFNFLAYWIFELKVADTVAKTVNKENATLLVVLSGVIAAIIWNLATWWGGIPSSSSHTLIGSFAGAGIANAGSFSAVQYDKVMPTVYFIVLAPLIGLFMAYLISILTINICRRFNPSKVDIVFRRLQLLSSAAYSLGHGGNDAQKVMGIIAAAMVSQGIIGDIKELPEWVPLACYTAIAAGTLIGGWKIVKTMGQKITKLSPFEGFSAETAGALTLFGTQHFKIPVSTTHTITGAIIGVGVTKRVSAVRWGVTIQLIWAWILTIPVSGLLAAGIFYLIRMFMN